MKTFEEALKDAQELSNRLNKWSAFYQGIDAARKAISRRVEQAIKDKDHSTLDALLTVKDYIREIKNPYS